MPSEKEIEAAAEAMFIRAELISGVSEDDARDRWRGAGGETLYANELRLDACVALEAAEKVRK